MYTNAPRDTGLGFNLKKWVVDAAGATVGRPIGGKTGNELSRGPTASAALTERAQLLPFLAAEGKYRPAWDPRGPMPTFGFSPFRIDPRVGVRNMPEAVRQLEVRKADALRRMGPARIAAWDAEVDAARTWLPGGVNYVAPATPPEFSPATSVIAPTSTAPGPSSASQGLPSSPMENRGVDTAPENEAPVAAAALPWPMILVAVGALLLLSSGKKGSRR